MGRYCTNNLASAESSSCRLGKALPIDPVICASYIRAFDVAWPVTVRGCVVVRPASRTVSLMVQARAGRGRTLDVDDHPPLSESTMLVSALARIELAFAGADDEGCPFFTLEGEHWAVRVFAVSHEHGLCGGCYFDAVAAGAVAAGGLAPV